MTWKEVIVWIFGFVLIAFTFHEMRGCSAEDDRYREELKRIDKNCESHK
jgi:hypothetical protein